MTDIAEKYQGLTYTNISDVTTQCSALRFDYPDGTAYFEECPSWIEGDRMILLSKNYGKFDVPIPENLK